MDAVNYPAVVVHSLADARMALAPGQPVTLLSGEGAVLYAGCGWWQALVDAARDEFPQVPTRDFLDCANASGLALGALRIGLRHLIVNGDAPGRTRIAAIVAQLGGVLLNERPPALDLRLPSHRHRLQEWVHLRTSPDDRRGTLR